MKKIHSMMLMLLVAVMSLCVQSCSKEETTVPGSIERVVVLREWPIREKISLVL